MQKDYNYFGVQEVNLLAAQKVAKKQKKHKLCYYVPSRKEVANLEKNVLTTMLVDWMCHSPTEIIPSRSQITEVKLILLQRADASEFNALITMCNYYINGD